MLAILATAVDTRAAAGWAPLTIGLTLAVLIVFLGPATSRSVNPARAFGPDLVATIFGYPVNWVAFVVSYLIGPLVGGVIGAFAYVAVAALPRSPAAALVGGRHPQAGRRPAPATAAACQRRKSKGACNPEYDASEVGASPWNGKKAEARALLKCALNVGASLLKRSKILLPIPGTASVQHLQENVQGATIKLTQEEYYAVTSMKAKGA